MNFTNRMATIALPATISASLLLNVGSLGYRRRAAVGGAT